MKFDSAVIALLRATAEGLVLAGRLHPVKAGLRTGEGNA